jgi:hypothetical protein
MVILGGKTGSSGTCGMLRGPWRVNVLLMDASFALKGASTSLEGDFVEIM